MVTRSQLGLVARELRKRLGNQAFYSVPRSDITELVRQVSGEETTRVKSVMGQELEQALLEQGVRCFPSLAETSAESVRLFHAGRLTGVLVDILRHPSPQTDKKLAETLTKLKGRWNWSHDDPGAPSDARQPFAPVEIRGEPLSATVSRDRR